MDNTPSSTTKIKIVREIVPDTAQDGQGSQGNPGSQDSNKRQKR